MGEKTWHQTDTGPTDGELVESIRDYLRVYVWRYGKKQALETFGVSRYTLWRFMERGHVGRSLPRAVLDTVGDSAEALEVARYKLLAELSKLSIDDSIRPLPEGLEDTLLLLYATPLASVGELARFGRIPASTLRDRLEKFADRGLVDSLSHRLGVLGPHPHRRYFPTEKGIIAGGRVEHGTDRFLSEYPVSRQWFWLLADRLDAIAVLYQVAALVADADPHGKPMRVDYYRQGPYDVLLTLSGGRSLGLIRQGPTLPTSNLRYRLRSMEQMKYYDKPTVTLVLTYSDQATRRAIRSLGDPWEHRTTFVATEAELLAGDAEGVVWQRCGTGIADDPPVSITPDVALSSIVRWTDRLVDVSYHVSNHETESTPTPDPNALYPSDAQADMPQPSRQLQSALSVRLTRADKEVLDLLAAWPLCTRAQLAGLKGGVTLRRVDQALQSLMRKRLVRSEGSLYVLTNEGLRYLARRDRVAVAWTLDRWSAEPSNGKGSVYSGSSLRVIDSQFQHHAGIIDFAASLSAEVSRSPDYDLFDLMPTSRSPIGYWYSGDNYVVHPDASFLLSYQGAWRPYFLEFERRATTPRRIRARLESYRRYFLSGWADRDHGGNLPLVLFVFESPDNEEIFLRVAAREERAPFFSSNVTTLAETGILGNSWRLPSLHPADRVQLRSLNIVAKVPFSP